MAISKRLRFEVLRRDNYICRYCGRGAPEVRLTVDHVTPEALGGGNDPGNLVTACADCNGGKTSIAPDSPLVDDVKQDALRWAQAISVAGEQMLADMGRRHAGHDEFDRRWNEYSYGPESDRRKVPRPDGWRSSVDSFLAAGLPLPVLHDCLIKAMDNQKIKVDDTFRYMCGIAWSRVTELQDAARKSITSDGVRGDRNEDPEGDLAVEVISAANSDEMQAALNDARYDFDGNELDARAREIAAATSLVCTFTYDRRRLAVLVLRAIDKSPPGVAERAHAEALAEHAKVYGEDTYLSGIDLLIKVANKALGSEPTRAEVNV